MIEVGSFQAKNRLSQLLNQAARGQHILITRRGQGVAVLCAPGAAQVGSPPGAPDDILTLLRAFREKVRSAGPPLKELIAEGRR